MIRTAICDDEPQIRADLAALIRAQPFSCEIVEYASASDCLADGGEVDLLFLDVELDAAGMDGMALAARLRERYSDVRPVIIFVTGYERYVFDAFDVGAFQYLLKPVNEEKLFQVLTKAVGRLARNERALTLELPGETVRIVLSRVRYMDVLHNYVTVHADRDYAVKRPLGELEKELDGRFFRVGRSCVLNLACVQRVTRTEVELTSGERIALPRGQYEKLNRAIVQRM